MVLGTIHEVSPFEIEMLRRFFSKNYFISLIYERQTLVDKDLNGFAVIRFTVITPSTNLIL